MIPRQICLLTAALLPTNGLIAAATGCISYRSKNDIYFRALAKFDAPFPIFYNVPLSTDLSDYEFDPTAATGQLFASLMHCMAMQLLALATDSNSNSLWRKFKS